MSRIDQTTSRAELAAIVVKQLQSKGVSAVLVGGSVVSLYTNNAYESKDLDFISPDDHKEVAKAMAEIGFTPKGKDFIHPQCQFTVEFPTGPVAIGDLVPVKPEGEMVIDGTKIVMYSPTQSVMDRLAWFYFSNDRQGLDQALLICKAQTVNLEKVKTWSIEENELEKYEIFLSHLKNRSHGG